MAEPTDTDADLQAALAASLGMVAAMDETELSLAMATSAMATSTVSNPTALGNVERLRAIVGDAVPDGCLERLLHQTDGNVEHAFELFCTDPDAYVTDAVPTIDLESGQPAKTIEGVWEASFVLLPPEHIFGAGDGGALARGDRILLPHEALVGFLDALMTVKGTRIPPTPICVRLTLNGVSRVCGIGDWSAPEGSVVVPQWLLDEFVPMLGGSSPPTAGSRVHIESADVPRATSVTLRPLGQAVRQLSRERQVELLTHGIQHIFTNVRRGDHLDIDGEGGGKFEVLSCHGRYDTDALSAGAGAGSSVDGGMGGGVDGRNGTAQEAVCVVAADNGVLEFDVTLEESVERESARRRFDAAREAYRQLLDAVPSSTSSLLIDDDDARDKLRALVNAADDATEAGCAFGEELELARIGLRAADRLADTQRMAREAKAMAEAARDAEAARLAQEAIAAQEAAEGARAEAVAAAEVLRSRFHSLVPEEPDSGGAPVRVQWPHGGTAQRRFEPCATLEQVRAWVMTAYPADSPTALTEDFVLKTRPIPGAPSFKIDDGNMAQTVEAARLGGQTLIFDAL